MTPTKVINSISLNMQVIHIIYEPIISNVTSPSTDFLCECCHAIVLIFLLSNFTLKFYLKNSAAMRGVSPSIDRLLGFCFFKKIFSQTLPPCVELM